MNRPLGRRTSLGLVATLAVAFAARPAVASDHADPVDPLMVRRIDGTLTGLFAFPTKGRSRSVADLSTGKWRPLTDPMEGDGLALILCVHRSLATGPPYSGMDEYTFKIFLDWDSEVRISYPREGSPDGSDEQATARYGGIVPRPDRIRETAVIAMRLDEQAGFAEHSAAIVEPGVGRPIVLSDDDWYAGVRDDPFIFPMFFGTNVVAMAVHIPYDQLPTGRHDFVIWATSERHGAQVDIVGRSQRTQLPRFDLLNTIHPRDHVEAIRRAREDPGPMQDLSAYLIPTEFRFRSFDLEPDVMIFSKRFPAGYPNGRRLEDDVAKLACAQGDCQLYEMSFAKPISPASEKKARYLGGRPTANDKPFLDTFPYLAEPWSPAHPAPRPTLSAKNRITLTLLTLLGVGVLLLPWILYFWALARLRSLARRGSTREV